MIVCKSCGWEIKKAMWGEFMCDDCAIDTQIQHNKEQGIVNG